MPDSRSFAIAGAPRKRSGHRKDEAEHERGEDQDLRHADPDLELRRALRAGQSGKGAGAPAGKADADDRQPAEDPTGFPAGRLADCEPRDRDRRGIRSVASPASNGRKRSSSVPRRRRPRGPDRRAHDRRRQVGHPRGIDVWIVCQSPSRRERTELLASLVWRLVSAVGARALCGLAENVVEPSLLDDPAVIDHGDAVADLLDLREQVRVEEDRRAARAGVRMIPRHRGARSDRAPTSARRGKRGPARRAARRPARDAAACPSRRSRRGRRRGRPGRPARAPRPPQRAVRARQAGQVAVQRAPPGRAPVLIAEQLGQVADRRASTGRRAARRARAPRRRSGGPGRAAA